MNIHDITYLTGLNYVYQCGESREDRTGTGTKSVLDLHRVYPFSAGFPLLTSKKVHWKSVVGELLWMLSGSTSNTELEEKYGVTIWSSWQDENGDLGLIYGAQWRNFGGAVDQISALEQNLRSDPFSRRHIVSAWNPMDLGKQSLPACHTMFQAYVQNDGSLWLKLFQRSGDMFLGVPFNIASYSLLCAMLAHTTGLTPGGLIHTITDAHIYNDHMNAVREQLARMEGCPDSPSIELNPNVTSILDFTPDDIKLLNYNPLSTIKAKVSV